MTNKTRNTILFASYALFMAFMLAMLYWLYYQPDFDLMLSVGLIVVEVVLLFLLTNVLPRFLEMRVDNQHTAPARNERLVFNGKIFSTRWIYILIFVFIFMFSFQMMLIYRDHPEYPVWRAIGHSLCFSIFFMLGMSPIWGDMIYRCIKNVYTIEGSNLIVDEWAWFRKKTDHLVIPVSEIESIRKKNAGLVQNCNLEIQVRGIKRILATGMVGDQLYDALKERME